MIQGCRDALKNQRANAQHAGMVLAYFLHWQNRGVPEENRETSAERGALLKAAGGAAGKAEPLYKLAFERWCAELTSQKVVCRDVQTQGRLIVGLGGKGVLETGLTLHHTYGVPYIPGSSLKGLTSHYGLKAAGLDAKQHTCLFGTTDDSGYAVFHDAWIFPESVAGGCLAPDVMTPHHTDYYMSGDAPLDNDKPIPVSYLSVKGDFRLAITCPDWPDGAEIAMELLLDALANWGAGGKTSSGYGRMHEIQDASR